MGAGPPRWGRSEPRSPSVASSWVPSCGYMFYLDAESGCHARAVGRIGLGAVGDMPLLNPEVGVAQGAGGVIEQGLLLFGAHIPEQVARLLVVVVVDEMIPPVRVALYLERRHDKGLVSIPHPPLSVGPVGRSGRAWGRERRS